MLDQINGNVGVSPIKKTCSDCGIEFLTKDTNETLCLGCKIFKEMKLPENTIVNQNVLNIYMSGKFDRQNGIDKYFLTVAEGVMLLDKKHDGNQLCSKATFIGEKTNDDIGAYVKNIYISNTYKKKYDAMVFVKVTSNSKFMVFGVSYSDRLYQKLIDKPVLFRKNYAISLALKWYYRDAK